MAIVESRLKDGLLTLGATPEDFSCQITNCRINSTYDDDGDAVETLCGDSIPPGRKLGGRALAGTVIQDWDAATGSFIDYCWDNDLAVVAFSFTPNAAGPVLSGDCRIEVPGETYGGDVNVRITSDFEFGIIGDVTRTAPVVQAAGTKTKQTVDA
jgi:hypothetical protein